MDNKIVAQKLYFFEGGDNIKARDISWILKAMDLNVTSQFYETMPENIKKFFIEKPGKSTT